MRAAVQTAFRPYSIVHEGFTPFMYCDSFNLVTTGIGNLIDSSARNTFDVSPTAMHDALLLPWKFRAAGWTTKNPLAGAACSQADIAAAFTTVKLQEQKTPGYNKNGGFTGYPGLTNITLDMDGINTLVSNKMASNEKRLIANYPNWNQLPADAQMAMMSMGWGMGPDFYPAIKSNGVPVFQAFKTCIDVQDFAGAAVHCIFAGGGSVTDPKSRNHDNVIMFNNAAAVKKVGANPDLLFFPGTSPSGSGSVPGVSSPGTTLTAGKVVGYGIVAGLFGWAGYEYYKGRKS